MNRLALIATAVLVIAAVAGGAYLLAGGPSRPSIATPTPASPTTAPSPSGRAPVIAAPATLWGDWRADTDGIPAIAQGPGQIQLSVDWQDGRTFWIQLSNGQTITLNSNPIESTGDEITLRATNTGPCTVGDLGRYRWLRSPDGMFLTLTTIEDACATRATAFARTWVHSLGAVNDGGPGVVFGVTPMTQVTLPTGQRYGAGGGEQWQDIGTFGDVLPFRAFVVVRNPGGFGAPCSTTAAQAVGLEHTTDAFVAYVKGLPGANVTTSTTTVGGRPSVRLDVSMGTVTPCPAGEIRAFHAETFAGEPRSDAGGWWAFGYGEVQPLYVVQMDADTTFLLWYQGTAVEERAVIDSITFIDALPTP